MNTLDKFLIITSYNRGNNYPTREQLDRELEINECSDNLIVDVYTYFMYDNESEY